MEIVIIIYLSMVLDIVLGGVIQDYFKIFSFLLVWNKNLGYHTDWPVAKPLWICPWYSYEIKYFFNLHSSLCLMTSKLVKKSLQKICNPWFLHLPVYICRTIHSRAEL